MWFPVLLCGVFSLGTLAVPAHYPVALPIPAKGHKRFMVAMTGNGNTGNLGNGVNGGQNVPAGEPGEAPAIDDFVPPANGNGANSNAGNAGTSNKNGGFGMMNMIVPYYPAANFLPGMQSAPGSADVNTANTIASMMMTSLNNANMAAASTGKYGSSTSGAANANGVNGNIGNTGNGLVDMVPVSVMNVAGNGVNGNSANVGSTNVMSTNVMDINGNAVVPSISMNMFSVGSQKGRNANANLNTAVGMKAGNANALNTNILGFNVNSNGQNNNGFEFGNNGFNFNTNGLNDNGFNFNNNGLNNDGFNFNNNGFNANNNGFNRNNNGFNFNNNGFELNNNGFNFNANGANTNLNTNLNANLNGGLVSSNGANTNVGTEVSGNSVGVAEDMAKANKARMDDVLRNMNGGVTSNLYAILNANLNGGIVSSNGANTNVGTEVSGNNVGVADDMKKTNKARMDDVLRNMNGGVTSNLNANLNANLNGGIVGGNGANTNVGTEVSGNTVGMVDEMNKTNKVRMDDVLRNMNGGAPGSANMNFMLMVPANTGNVAPVNAGNVGNAMNVNNVMTMNGVMNDVGSGGKGSTGGMNMLVHGPDCILPGQPGNNGSGGSAVAGTTSGSNGTPIFVLGNVNAGNTGNVKAGKY